MPASAISEQILCASLMRPETGGKGEYVCVCVRLGGACLSGFYVLVPTRDHICSGSISANHLSLSAANKVALSGTGTRRRLAFFSERPALSSKPRIDKEPRGRILRQGPQDVHCSHTEPLQSLTPNVSTRGDPASRASLPLLACTRTL